MMKMLTTDRETGHQTLVLGLSDGNVELLCRDQPILFDLAEVVPGQTARVAVLYFHGDGVDDRRRAGLAAGLADADRHDGTRAVRHVAVLSLDARALTDLLRPRTATRLSSPIPGWGGDVAIICAKTERDFLEEFSSQFDADTVVRTDPRIL